MVMAWRSGAVDSEAVVRVIMDGDRFSRWMVSVPADVRPDSRWLAAGSIVTEVGDREPEGTHMYHRRSIVAVVESWAPPQMVLRLRRGLGGWVRSTITVQSRSGGSLIEVRAEPITASARLRYAGPSRSRPEDRCAAVVESLIRLTAEEVASSN